MVESRKYMVNDNDKNLEIYVKLLGDNNAHCLEIIGDLLTEERERLPTISVKISKIDIVESISLVFDELRGSHRNREFIFDSHSDKIYMYTDVVKMLEVVNNFTSNAIKFSRTEKPIRVSISDYADHVVVCVMDEGIGIPQYLSEHIFQRQNGHGRQGLNGERSLGHGLFICKHLIDLMHGHIWFESVEGKGSTFYFSLPKN